MFTIIHKQTKEYFAGFGANGSVKFTSDKSKAWTNTHHNAKTQAALFVCHDVNVQRKPIAL